MEFVDLIFEDKKDEERFINDNLKYGCEMDKGKRLYRFIMIATLIIGLILGVIFGICSTLLFILLIK